MAISFSSTGVGERVVITTDANGHAETGWLPYGRYRVEETGVPENYVDNRLSTTVDVYEDGQTYAVEVQNEPLKGYISLTKTDRLDGQSIAGVQFDIYYDDEYGTGPAGTMTTNANGVATSSPLRKGSYIVREHGEPTGYVTELVGFDAEVEPDETTDLSATNQPIQGYIRIVKSDELTGEVLAGAEFTITRINGLPSHNGSNDGEMVAVITTDASGVAISPLLTWGTYRVTETGVPVHYVDNSFSVDVTVSERMNTYEVDVENEPTKGWIRLVKTDRLNGNPIEGVQFDIYYIDQYGEGLAATMVTDKNGVAISQPLLKGQYPSIKGVGLQANILHGFSCRLFALFPCSVFPFKGCFVHLDWLTACVFALRLGDGDSFRLTLQKLLAFKLCQSCEDGQHQFTLWRAGVNILFQADESNTLLLQLVNKVQQIARAACKTAVF